MEKTELRELFEIASHPPKRGFGLVDWEDRWVVVFRPTEGTVWSWMWNLFVAPFNKIAFGTAMVYLSVANRVIRTLEARERRTGQRKRVIFTGFSRGGALAEMCAIDPAFAMYEPLAVSFAAPRWTVRSLDTSSVLRVQVKGDIVCRVPPWPYRDVGRTVRYRWRGLPSVKAHRYAVYREALRE